MVQYVNKPKSINDLLSSGGKRVAALKTQTEERSRAREHVCAALPENLAAAVVSAGVEKGHLTIGVAGAPWAARLRYVTETLRMRVSGSMGIDILTVRIKVVPPRAHE
jgi:hypothetical protein